jgi:hypothetical protein
MRHKFIMNEKGMGLVEVIAAFGISVVVITSLVSLAIYTTRSTLNSKLLLEGTKIASREMERVRAYRDSTDWVTTFRPSVIPCVANCYISSGAVSNTYGTETIDGQPVRYYFTAVGKDAGPNYNIIRISVTASWNVGGVTKTTKVYTDLTNWQTN